MNTLKPRVTFEFEVEKVIGVSPDGRYQVQWTPSWMSKFQLVGCEHLIQEFMKEQMEMENRLEKEKQAEKNPEVQFVAREDVLNNSKGRNCCEDITVPGLKSESEIPRPWSMDITITDESIDMKESAPFGNFNPDESSKEFMTLMEGLLNCSSTEKQSNVLNPPEDVQEPESPPNDFEISHASEDGIKRTSNTSHSGDLVVPVSLEKDTGISLALVRSSLSKETVHSKGIQRKKNGRVLRERKKLTQPRKAVPVGTSKKSVRRRKDLHSHTLAHVNKGRTTCDVCKKSFSYPSALKIHYRTHTDERPYSCHYCDKSFRGVGTWKDHERIHTGAKPYRCLKCRKSFSSSSGLGSHRRNLKH